MFEALERQTVLLQIGVGSPQVDGFAGAQYKSFSTREDAAQYLAGLTAAPAVPALIPPGHVVIYADGACSGNPGPGGWGAIIRDGGKITEMKGGEAATTNNRMELLAAIVALETLKEPCSVLLHSDSEYLVKAMTLGWAKKWRANGWKLASRQPAASICGPP